MMPVKKRKRVPERSELQAGLESLTRRVEVLEGLKAAAARGAQGFTYGRRVAYYGQSVRFGYRSPWHGIVIPLPAGYRAVGQTGERLIWVLTEFNTLCGCYAENLCFV